MRLRFPSGRRVPQLLVPSATLRAVVGACVTLALAAGVARTAFAVGATLPAGFTDHTIATGFDFPVNMAFLPDGRLLFVQHYDGKVRLIANGALAPGDPVCVIDSVNSSSERGLLGIAIDPGWPARPYVYLQFTWTGGPFERIARYTATGDLDFTGDGHLSISNASRFEILPNLTDSVQFHNGGTLQFGPDGMLYSSVGDDVGAFCGAQAKGLLRGKILRLDVSSLPPGPGGPPALATITPADNPFVADPRPTARLVWQFGLRNPFSFEIDPASGNLVIAEPGDNTYEELDLATAPGLNFGFPYYEGPRWTGYPCANPDTLGGITGPIYYYDRTEFTHGAAIVTGGVYHRPATGADRFPAEYEGDIFLSDVGEGFLRRLHFDGTSWVLAAPVAGQPNATDWALNMDGTTDYVERPDGSLWYCKHAEGLFSASGEIHRITYTPPVTGVEPQVAATRFLPPAPSPFRHEVTLAWTQERAAVATLTVHDLAGRRIRELASGPSDQGPHRLSWDGRDAQGAMAPPGLYLFRLSVGDQALTARALKLR